DVMFLKKNFGTKQGLTEAYCQKKCLHQLPYDITFKTKEIILKENRWPLLR
uniref:Uncharacterized protein n=1 Tax=Oryza brachyantha TaxID=4533 RepID=J3LBU3_ORYBR